MRNKKISIRITQEQYDNLCQNIISENLSKSGFIRNLIDEYSTNCRKKLSKFSKKKNNKFNLLGIVKRNM